MKKHIKRQFGHDLGFSLESLSLIKENAYCRIYRAMADGRPLIIKKYKGNDSTLVQAESKALDCYHQTAKDHPALIDSRTVMLNAEKNLLCIEFVEGECFSRLLYRSLRNREVRQRSLRIMAILGGFLKHLYEISYIPEEKTDPFIFKYLDYCSTQLESLPILGHLLFRGYQEDAAELKEALRQSGVSPSFVHGDFVFRNMRVSGNRVGLIDFANSNPRSHLLNDVYNLRFALENMILSDSFKRSLFDSFYQELGRLCFPEISHRFYYEYHRRRWLMLKIKNYNPYSWLQTTIGLSSFAKPFEPKVIY